MPFPALRSHFGQLASRWRGFLRPASARFETPEPSHSLLPLETRWVDTQPGLQVTCLDGCLVLNYAGEPHDIILVRGESHACASSGRMAVQALIATAVLVH